MPVLAIGGERSFGEHVGEAVRAVADDVRSAVIPGTGHFLAEESPDELLAELAAFLAPYRAGAPVAAGELGRGTAGRRAPACYDPGR